MALVTSSRVFLGWAFGLSGEPHCINAIFPIVGKFHTYHVIACVSRHSNSEQCVTSSDIGMAVGFGNINGAVATNTLSTRNLRMEHQEGICFRQ